MTKQPTQLEADIRAGVVPFAKKLGVIHIRMHMGGGAAAGYPDDLFLFPNGVSLWVEFKRPGRTADPLQVMRMKQLMDMGHPALVVDDIAMGRDAMRTFFAASLGIEAIPPSEEYVDPDQRGLVNDPDA